MSLQGTVNSSTYARAIMLKHNLAADFRGHTTNGEQPSPSFHRITDSRSYRIMSLANIDPRILGALRGIRTGDISYRTNACNPPDLLSSLSTDLGYPSAWGDISRIPAFGGVKAADAWKAIGVPTRDGLGGIPCELVHGGVTGSSCTANAVIRGAHAFVEALAIYLPVSPCKLACLLPYPSHLLFVVARFTPSQSCSPTHKNSSDHSTSSAPPSPFSAALLFSLPSCLPSGSLSASHVLCSSHVFSQEYHMTSGMDL